MTQPFRFLSLPPEIRNLIYKLLLNPSVIQRTDQTDPEELPITSYAFHLITPLLSVSRQIHSEALPIFYRSFNFILITTPWDEAITHVSEKSRVPVLFSGEQAEHFDGWSLAVDIRGHMMPPPGAAEDDWGSVFVILGKDLERFTKMWEYSDLDSGAELNYHLTLALKVRDPCISGENESEALPLSLQRALLEPFGALKRLARVRVEGEFDEGVEKSMRAKMAEEQTSPEECLERGNALKDQGNLLLKAKKPKEALELYMKAFEAIHIICVGRYRGVWGDAWFDRHLSGEKYSGQRGQLVRIILRTRLVAAVVKAYLDLKNWEEARFWGHRTITLVTGAFGLRGHQPALSYPAAIELGKIYYRTALALKNLDRKDEAKEYLRAAAGYLPNDPIIRAELAAISPTLYI